MNERIREIALRFFEGRSRRKRECELYGFLNGNPQGLAQMREWESCWKRDHVPPADVLDSLDSLRRKNSAAASAAPSVAAYLGCGRGAGARLDARAASPSGRKARTAFTVKAPQGTHSRISLPDGTQVWLNAGSALSYGSSFNETSREVSPLEAKPFRGGAPCGTAVPCRSARLYVHRSRHEVRHLGYAEDPAVTAALLEGGAAFRVGGQAGRR